ncbi:hypothetical protein [Synechococcus sp. CC9605]|uniref:hypothetical protein n=1 Tax=Synechococcus sp. (strain CC9605) TaxID=110662 RepID=UPI00005D5A78|nr:hypothetical protein [Synechococcus sp. CC9605]ABB35101.1 hypothetical protein Syncc9605_1347 [Synechococcus sp. CC9605]
MKMMRKPEGTPLSAADALAVDYYRSKQYWVEFNDDLLDDRPEGIDLIERSEAWSRVNKLFRNLEIRPTRSADGRPRWHEFGKQRNS